MSHAVLWEVISAQDDRVSEECRERDGDLVDVVDRSPPFHVNCRCVFVPVAFESEDERVARELRNAVGKVRGLVGSFGPTCDHAALINAQLTRADMKLAQAVARDLERELEDHVTHGLAQAVARDLEEKLMRELEDHITHGITHGDGSPQPVGILNATGQQRHG